jgi:hypothetical protein
MAFVGGSRGNLYLSMFMRLPSLPGGGTTDVTIIVIKDDNHVKVLGTSRYNDFAGDDLDLEIAALILKKKLPFDCFLTVN